MGGGLGGSYFHDNFTTTAWLFMFLQLLAVFNVCFDFFRVPDTEYEEIQPQNQDNFGEVKYNLSLIYMNCIQKPRLNLHCLICLLLPYLQIHLIPRINLQYV